MVTPDTKFFCPGHATFYGRTFKCWNPKGHGLVDLRHALEQDEFRVYYQPKIDLATGRMTGMEALLRWMHPGMGMISPTKFIPLAEETHLILQVGDWVLAVGPPFGLGGPVSSGIISARGRDIRCSGASTDETTAG